MKPLHRVLTGMEPCAIAFDTVREQRVAVFRPWWSAGDRVPVREIGESDRMGASKVIGSDRLINIRVFAGKESEASFLDTRPIP